MTKERARRNKRYSTGNGQYRYTSAFENELGSKVIMERMKQQAGEISARQAAEVVQNSLRAEETIKAAEEQYNEVIKEIIRQRDEAGTITTEQADKLIQRS